MIEYACDSLNEYFLCLQSAEDNDLQTEEKSCMRTLRLGKIIYTKTKNVWVTARVSLFNWTTHEINVSLFHGKTLKYVAYCIKVSGEHAVKRMRLAEELGATTFVRKDDEFHRIT